METLGPKEVEWAFAFVNGQMMYLQQADDTTRSGAVLAHEMTHLVANRFFRNHPPIWLNEGIAEWYEEFGYAAYKGIKKSRGREFHALRDAVGLEALFAMKKYPADEKDVRAFYLTSKYLIGFLQLDYSREKFGAYLRGVMEGADPVQSLLDHYEFEDLAHLQKKFAAFGDFRP
jgi:hypothetical protein